MGYGTTFSGSLYGSLVKVTLGHRLEHQHVSVHCFAKKTHIPYLAGNPLGSYGYRPGVLTDQFFKRVMELPFMLVYAAQWLISWTFN